MIDTDVYSDLEKDGLNVNHTKHAARETRIESDKEKKAYTHDTGS